MRLLVETRVDDVSAQVAVELLPELIARGESFWLMGHDGSIEIGLKSVRILLDGDFIEIEEE
jgi:hypothetical protein